MEITIVDVLTVIISILGLLQLGFFFVIKRVFYMQDKLFSVIENNKKECSEKIQKNYDEAKEDREKMKLEHTTLLDKHYVTNGQLSTLEEKLVGQIKNLAISIGHLTTAIKEKGLR